jgi:hypothetical protein
MQAQLLIVGMYAGPLTGDLDGPTLEALRQFQDAAGLDQTSTRSQVPWGPLGATPTESRLNRDVGTPNLAAPFLSGPLLTNDVTDGGVVARAGDVFESTETQRKAVIVLVSSHRGFAYGVVEQWYTGETKPQYSVGIQVAPLREPLDHFFGKGDVGSPSEAATWARLRIDQHYSVLLDRRRKLITGQETEGLKWD